jgi:hypothetical protein
METVRLTEKDIAEKAWPFGEIIGLDLNKAVDCKALDDLMAAVSRELAKHGLEIVAVEQPNNDLGWAIRPTLKSVNRGISVKS